MWVVALLFICLGLDLACLLVPRGRIVYRTRWVDLLEHFSRAVNSPRVAGEGLVAVRSRFLVGGVVRPALYAQPNAEVTFSALSLHEEPRLEFGLGIHEVAWKGPGDGVRFEVTLQDARGETHLLFSQEIDPVHREQDRRWINVSLDLSAFARQSVSITFRTNQREDPLNDWAAWASPMLSSKEALRVGTVNHPNVLLITIDTLRADHLSVYGYERDTSPHLENLAEEGVLFEQAYCQAALTTPSHASILSSLYPRTHKLYENGFLSPKVRTLSTILQEQRYSTAAVVGVKFLLPQFSGLGQGFDTFFPFPEKTDSGAERPAEEVTSLAVFWIEAHHQEPFFLWVHYYDPHWPYRPPVSYDTRFYQQAPDDPGSHSVDDVPPKRDRIVGDETDFAYQIAQYDGEIAYVDEQVGQLLNLLEILALDDNTLVIVVADHGESLTEHGVYFDHWALYEETIHVPLIMRYPGRLPAGRRIPSLVEAGVDIVPTVLDLIDLTPLAESEGRSLIPLIHGQEEPPRVVFSEQRDALAMAMRTDQYKFILHRASNREAFPRCPLEQGKRELYDLWTDPGELDDLISEAPGWAVLGDHFEALCRGWLGQTTLQIEPVTGGLNGELEELLKELGY